MLPEHSTIMNSKNLDENGQSSMKTDGTQWLNNVLAKGWRGGKSANWETAIVPTGDSKDGQDDVESNFRADVPAKHFETVQWCKRFATEVVTGSGPTYHYRRMTSLLSK